MVAGSPRLEWLDANEAELIQIEPVDEHINRTHRIVLSHVVVEQRGEQRALSAINPLHEARHRSSPADSLQNNSRGRSFHTAWVQSRRSPHALPCRLWAQERSF